MNILLIGSQGKMGKLFCESVNSSKTDHIVAGVDIQNKGVSKSPYFSHKEYKTIWSVKEKFDLIVDFSTQSGKGDIINLALLQKVPLAIFSTTCSAEDILSLKNSSKYIPILVCPNASKGVNALSVALASLSQSLYKADVVVTEHHHKHKIDSPSGTAKSLIKILNDNGSKPCMVNALRVGDECGYHCVEFFLEGEVVTLSHRATSKKIFSQGAYEMVKKLATKTSGYYTIL